MKSIQNLLKWSARAGALIFVFMLFFAGDGDKCPTKGDSPKTKLQVLDTLKNRTNVSKNIVTLNLADVLKPGDDTKRYSENTYVSITGYVFLVKYGGSETCNCHATDKTQLDIHIEIVTDMKTGDNTKAMVVEINRYIRAKDKNMDIDAVKALKGKKVQITGWLFFDEEHKQNAVNTSPKGTNLWRATCWEVHPCMSIKEVK
jgi:hypothetical protein